VNEKIYNPLDKINLGKSVAEALLDKEVESLGSIKIFKGAGIYAIYYRGNFPPYAPLARRNGNRAEWPIYIGKAIPSGGRTGIHKNGKAKKASDNPLWDRLDEHADSIRATHPELNIEDFICRYLTIDDVWIPLGETLLISSFRPLWNVKLTGFGNHDPGAGRHKGKIPLWDIIHPGREWAPRLTKRSETKPQLEELAREFLENNEPPEDPRIRFKSGGQIDDGLV
jgi:hypothetical protein